MRTPGSQSREILALAVPAFLALVAEPLFLLADTAIVGHLGTGQLAGLGVASSILATAAGVFVFLAYGTTSVVARQVGAGDERAALASGLDGVWLALILGAATALVVGFAAAPLCGLFGASAQTAGYAATYLRISAGGIPAMLVVLAATGALRGFQDTRTPLVASVLGFGANLALNLVLVLGLGWGIAGSAWGTVTAQIGMGVGLVTVVVRRALAGHATLRPEPGRVLGAAASGVPLLVRTLALRAILLVTTWVAAGLGDVPLAAHQVAGTIWSFLAFVLDALAIAGQAITGKALGAGDVAAVRGATSTMLRWGVWAGVVLGAVLIAVHGVLPALFTSDPGVRQALGAALVVIGLTSWLSGLVFVVDGVLIGAGDGRWLAGAMAATLVAYLPLVLVVRWFTPWLAAHGAPVAVAVLWAVFTAFMAIRWGFLRHRVRGDGWLVTGAAR
ncbi:MATE family efflux transporter [Propionicimonas sp.]|uniref:MATE family efflux transporter n=1 Tax=Propionicimonas sp. TaxID=1955623 RepID=UPI0039E5EA39